VPNVPNIVPIAFKANANNASKDMASIAILIVKSVLKIVNNAHRDLAKYAITDGS